MPKRSYGWVHDLPDHRDFLYSAPVALVQNLPPKIDLTAKCPPVYDQGQLGSCTGNAIAAAIQFDLMRQARSNPPAPAAPTVAPKGTDVKSSVFMPSRLFIYYNERVMENTVKSDSGAQIRDGIKSVASQGACPETDWPYAIDKFADEPTPNCYKDALGCKALSYRSVLQNLSQFQGCLASGSPFVFGFTVYESFESDAVARTGIVPMPSTTERVVGGHAVMCVGYDDTNRYFIVRNSWGTDWGLKGYFELPYSYLLDENLSDDFWVINVVGE
jgi:C1A family cysteine protease